MHCRILHESFSGGGGGGGGGGRGGGYDVTIDTSAFLQNKFGMAMSPDPFSAPLSALGKGYG